jgi:DNA-binding NtrC family response regulator
MSEKVLLVDDEQEFLDSLAERMQSRGMKVSKAATPAEAILKTEQESFDAVVLDLKMQGMDGLEVLRIIKEKRPEIQVILLTGHATVEAGVEAMKLGALDFVEKPANLAELTKKIKEAQAKKMILVDKATESKIKEIIQAKAW